VAEAAVPESEDGATVSEALETSVACSTSETSAATDEETKFSEGSGDDSGVSTAGEYNTPDAGVAHKQEVM
jgi:hypothetical protein